MAWWALEAWLTMRMVVLWVSAVFFIRGSRCEVRVTGAMWLRAMCLSTPERVSW